jgi:hypothetical protein
MGPIIMVVQLAVWGWLVGCVAGGTVGSGGKVGVRIGWLGGAFWIVHVQAATAAWGSGSGVANKQSIACIYNHSRHRRDPFGPEGRGSTACEVWTCWASQAGNAAMNDLKDQI